MQHYLSTFAWIFDLFSHDRMENDAGNHNISNRMTGRNVSSLTSGMVPTLFCYCRKRVTADMIVNASRPPTLLLALLANVIIISTCSSYAGLV